MNPGLPVVIAFNPRFHSDVGLERPSRSQTYLSYGVIGEDGPDRLEQIPGTREAV